jgi:hypothetical protein
MNTQREGSLTRRALFVVLLALATSGRSPFLSAQDTVLRVSGDVTSPLTLSAADVARMPHVSVSLSGRGSQTTTYEGVLLIDILKGAGIPTGDALRGAELNRYIVVTGADGYRAVFALAELDPAFSDRPALLADRRDGAALAENARPFVVVTPGDKRPTRWVRQAVQIDVQRAREPGK